jgi:SH3 and multiple ankyrin repeat domains protein
MIQNNRQMGDESRFSLSTTNINKMMMKVPPSQPPPLPPPLQPTSSQSCQSIYYGEGHRGHDNSIDDSGIDSSDNNNNSNNQNREIFIRVSIADQNLQKVLKFNLDDYVWGAKQRVLSTVAKEIKDGLNYGFYLPPFQGRAGKFLDDCRQLKEYSLCGPVVNLEFKYKKRVYKFIKINQKELKALNVKANFKRFLDFVRTNQINKVTKLLEKGIDPNFHSDLGETPLTIACSLADPRTMIMTLYNGGAHLDFRSRDTFTPMHKSASIGNDTALKALLELGAFAEVFDAKHLTPLYYAITNSSSVQSIEYLLFNGSPIGIKDQNNWQEIHHVSSL